MIQYKNEEITTILRKVSTLMGLHHAGAYKYCIDVKMDIVFVRMVKLHQLMYSNYATPTFHHMFYYRQNGIFNK